MDPTGQRSRRGSGPAWPATPLVVTQFTISCAVELLRLVTSDNISDNITHIMTVIVEKVINIYQNSRGQTAKESVWSVSKLLTESVNSCRELVANCVHTADAT